MSDVRDQTVNYDTEAVLDKLEELEVSLGELKEVLDEINERLIEIGTSRFNSYEE